MENKKSICKHENKELEIDEKRFFCNDCNKWINCGDLFGCENCINYGTCDSQNYVPDGKNGFCSKFQLNKNLIKKNDKIIVRCKYCGYNWLSKKDVLKVIDEIPTPTLTPAGKRFINEIKKKIQGK